MGITQRDDLYLSNVAPRGNWKNVNFNNTLGHDLPQIRNHLLDSNKKGQETSNSVAVGTRSLFKAKRYSVYDKSREQLDATGFDSGFNAKQKLNKHNEKISSIRDRHSMSFLQQRPSIIN
jgi:hypothetical protein